MRFLLDTNTVIALIVRRNRSVLASLIANRGEVASSVIVLHELYYGAFNSTKLEQNLDELSSFELPMLPFEMGDARVAGEVRAALRQLGTPIGAFDLLIAGQALARDLTIVTNNVREFSRVQGLRVEDWTQG